MNECDNVTTPSREHPVLELRLRGIERLREIGQEAERYRADDGDVDAPFMPSRRNPSPHSPRHNQYNPSGWRCPGSEERWYHGWQQLSFFMRPALEHAVMQQYNPAIAAYVLSSQIPDVYRIAPHTSPDASIPNLVSCSLKEG